MEKKNYFQNNNFLFLFLTNKNICIKKIKNI